MSEVRRDLVATDVEAAPRGELPGWHKATLGEIAEVQGGITKGKQRGPGDKLRAVPYLRVANVQRGYLDLAEIKKIDATEEEIRQYCLHPGDVLFNEGGDRDKLGRGWVWGGEIVECIHQNHVFRARIHEGVLLPKLLSWYGNSKGQAYFLSEGKQTTNLASLNSTKLRALPVLIPPGPEQHRIVAEVESYFTRLDDAVATLERVERNLKRYRASVLKAAVEGRLVPTEAALAKQEGRSYEPASVLLERILTERRRCWFESGKKGKYEEPTPPDTTILPDLPEGWCWVSFDAVSVNVDGGNAATASSEPSERTILTSRAVRQGYIDFADVRFLPKEAEQKANPYIGPGDLLFTRLSGTLDYVGNCAVVSDGVPPRLEFPDRIFRARCVSVISRRYIQHCFADRTLRRQLERAAKSTAGHQRISLSDLRMYALPLPPLVEQERIVAEVDRLLSALANVDTTMQTNRSRSQRLRQSVLKWAFEGKLTDQDPKDESASALLKRIKVEREGSKVTKDVTSQRAAKKKQVRA